MQLRTTFYTFVTQNLQAAWKTGGVDKGVDKEVFERECYLFFCIQFPSTMFISNISEAVITLETQVFVTL